MFNNSLFEKEASLKIAEREHEAETYRLHTQLGYGDRKPVRWAFGILTVIAALIVGMILL